MVVIFFVWKKPRFFNINSLSKCHQAAGTLTARENSKINCYKSSISMITQD